MNKWEHGSILKNVKITCMSLENSVIADILSDKAVIISTCLYIFKIKNQFINLIKYILFFVFLIFTFKNK